MLQASYRIAYTLKQQLPDTPGHRCPAKPPIPQNANPHPHDSRAASQTGATASRQERLPLATNHRLRSSPVHFPRPLTMLDRAARLQKAVSDWSGYPESADERRVPDCRLWRDQGNCSGFCPGKAVRVATAGYISARDPRSPCGFPTDQQHFRRRSQAAKAADCKSAIPGSNPGGASLRHLSPEVAFFVQIPPYQGVALRLLRRSP